MDFSSPDDHQWMNGCRTVDRSTNRFDHFFHFNICLCATHSDTTQFHSGRKFPHTHTRVRQYGQYGTHQKSIGACYLSPPSSEYRRYTQWLRRFAIISAHRQFFRSTPIAANNKTEYFRHDGTNDSNNEKKRVKRNCMTTDDAAQSIIQFTSKHLAHRPSVVRCRRLQLCIECVMNNARMHDEMNLYIWKINRNALTNRVRCSLLNIVV